MCPSPTQMSIDCPHIECKFHNDRRLIVGVATIVAHAAAHAGLRNREREKLVAATMEACEKGCCAAGLKDDSVARMGISSFPDRVEVDLEFPDAVFSSRVHSEEQNGKPTVHLVQHRETEKSKPAP